MVWVYVFVVSCFTLVNLHTYVMFCFPLPVFPLIVDKFHLSLISLPSLEYFPMYLSVFVLTSVLHFPTLPWSCVFFLFRLVLFVLPFASNMPVSAWLRSGPHIFQTLTITLIIYDLFFLDCK